MDHPEQDFFISLFPLGKVFYFSIIKNVKNKHLLVSFFILLLGAGVSVAVYYLSPTAPPNQPPVVNQEKENVLTEELKPAELKSSPSPETKTELKSSPEEEKNLISAQLMVGEKKYETSIAAGSNAYDLMKKLSETQGLQFSTKEYPGLGHFVEEINGVKNDKQKGIYWIFYINNQSSQLGISSYILKNNDIISWKYETAQF